MTSVRALPLVLPCALAALLASRAPAQVPTLSHTAPRLGSRLELALEGAAPGARVRLYVGGEESSQATPFGTLEIERTGLTLLAIGTADPSGRFSHQEWIPREPALAETWRHYQALVEDAGSPAGWVLSEAAHLRLVGTRVYESCTGLAWGQRLVPAELRVVSAVHETTLGTLRLASRLAAVGSPVWTDDLAWGAVVVSGDELVVFDNFRLEQRSALHLGEMRSGLVPGVDGRTAVVFQPQMQRLLWVDLESGAVATSLALPWPVTGSTAVSADRTQMWLAETQTGQPRPVLRRVDLASRRVLEGVPVGPPRGSTLVGLSWAPGLVLALTSHVEPTWGSTVHTITTLELSSAPPGVQLVAVPFDPILSSPIPLPSASRIALRLGCTIGPCGESLALSRLSPAPDFHQLQMPPWAHDLGLRALVSDGDGFWLLDDCYGWDGAWGVLAYYSEMSSQWRVYGSWGFGGPLAMALARDGLVDKVYVALDGTPGLPWQLLPELHVLDLSSNQWKVLEGGWGPIGLSVLSVP